MKVIKKAMQKAAKKQALIKFRPQVKSRHATHNILRQQLPLLPFRSVVRLGSETVMQDVVSRGGNRLECNTTEAVRKSADKSLMKKAFYENSVKTAQWYTVNNSNNLVPVKTNEDAVKFPVVAKHIFGSRGTGNYLLKSKEEFDAWKQGKDLSNYIFEKFYSYNREYRLHVTKNGCFYTCRKMLKGDTPETQRWFRNDSNCTWFVEGNNEFDKPVNWDSIVQESVKALNAVGLDIGAVDVKVQSTTKPKGQKRENPKFIILEINSAPSFGKITGEKYLQEIPKILTTKKI